MFEMKKRKTYRGRFEDCLADTYNDNHRKDNSTMKIHHMALFIWNRNTMSHSVGGPQERQCYTNGLQAGGATFSYYSQVGLQSYPLDIAVSHSMLDTNEAHNQ